MKLYILYTIFFGKDWSKIKNLYLVKRLAKQNKLTYFSISLHIVLILFHYLFTFTQQRNVLHTTVTLQCLIVT